MGGCNVPASIRFPKNFHPVGVTKQGMFSFLATKSSAPEVGIDLATPQSPFFLKYGMCSLLAAMTASESQGVTKNAFRPNKGQPGVLLKTSISTYLPQRTP